MFSRKSPLLSSYNLFSRRNLLECRCAARCAHNLEHEFAKILYHDNFHSTLFLDEKVSCAALASEINLSKVMCVANKYMLSSKCFYRVK